MNDEEMMYYRRLHVYGSYIAKPTRTIKFNFKQRVKRAIRKKSFNQLFIKEIVVNDYTCISTMNIQA